ncbi:MAG TPA: maleylpyruvate isomerase N-terminal domain-containing protein [Candidatus Avipropionibacterium avicola]|uniref:Maleylpyruvate isomerase N-terminal domain-containing protein n=1 Tax=Candidatus Avipropionibacterium avicola TaxID=2840701 RepID=A0A9D1H028_9ACTN|nr:maleylpyruvate isomerase N-terminal domain-containing protein [Candidatus Avipropionibacterium avicola]
MDPIAVIRHESNLFADVLAATDPQAQVPTCPDWDAADLLWHLTEVHLFWSAILASDARDEQAVEAIEQAKPARPDTIGDTLALREQATTELAAQLTRLDDAEPRWSWWSADQTVGFTRRMQTCEATMHRVDAELTAGLAVTPLEPEVATLAIEHAFRVMWAWLPDWASWESLAVVELLASDTGQRWLLDVGHWTGTGPDSGEAFDWPRAVLTETGEADGTVTATIDDLARWAWTRGTDVTVRGSEQAAGALDRLLSHGID